MISWEEYQKHNNEDSCWVLIDGKIHDVTDFIKEHPGGPTVLLKYFVTSFQIIWTRCN